MDNPLEDVYYGADMSGNLFALRHQVEAVTDEERAKLEGCAEMHLGEYLNVMRPGSLVGQPISDDAHAGGPVGGRPLGPLGERG
eukprot:CAMPEP_0173290470 /NCGR_PEP_ID=MMETSP1143-20121109/11578_1 /TAXON_ID=483371 /ORGANISM="non described non described, Strain CCMP2298" /LENGTH=83 /DNA_ID=CAMNT_0014229525 /DNA_START=41 /DNA_END=288 /DNA_ORIENTATION=+